MPADNARRSTSSVLKGYRYTTSHYCNYPCGSLSGGREQSRMALRARLMMESVTVFIAGARPSLRAITTGQSTLQCIPPHTVHGASGLMS